MQLIALRPIAKEEEVRNTFVVGATPAHITIGTDILHRHYSPEGIAPSVLEGDIQLHLQMHPVQPDGKHRPESIYALSKAVRRNLPPPHGG